MGKNKKMITSYLMGGLGNILFQISAALSVGYKTNKPVKFSYTDHYLQFSGRNSSNYRDNILLKINFTEESFSYNDFFSYHEPSYSYKEIPTQVDSLILKGYFQSEKYFKEFEENIRDMFCETKDISEYINKKFSNICFDECTSLHVRRGDYLQFPETHPICDTEYYNNAVSLIGETKNILIFSDDITWCKNNLFFNNMIFIEGEKDYIDLYLMSRCKNNIIANSTFSWWGAWLNNNANKKIIAPIKWFGSKAPKDVYDLIPDSWIRI
jgi:hypothetical protein